MSDAVDKYLLMTAGFIRDIYKEDKEMETKIVPLDIINLIFAYESPRDQWDKKYISPQFAKLENDYCVRVTSLTNPVTIYGATAVDSISGHHWILQLKCRGYVITTKQKKMIGIIKDDIFWLKSRQNKDNWYQRSSRGGYSFDTASGRMMPTYRFYAAKRIFDVTNDILEIKLKDSKLSYIINDRDYEVAIANVIPQKYRLCIYLSGCAGAMIELWSRDLH